MPRKPQNKVPAWFLNEKESDIINYIIDHKDGSGIYREILLKNKIISYSAAMSNEVIVIATIIYQDRHDMKNNYVQSVFYLSDYLNYFRRRKINKIINNL